MNIEIKSQFKSFAFTFLNPNFYFTIVTFNRQINLKAIHKIKFFTFFFFFSGVFSIGYAQMYFGFKAGANASKSSFYNEDYQKFYDSKIKPGFTAGAVFLIENNEKYGLYTEIAYSVKGKSIVSHANDYETNTATYHFIDVPIMFRMKFQQQKFNWFLQFGPDASYWLSGKGVFEVYDPNRDLINNYEYKINFGEPEISSEYMNVDEANRLQLGLAIGGGFIWDLKNANYISFDMRFSFGHSFMGGYESGTIPNIGLVDNFEHTNNVLGLSAVYYFNILEKVRLGKKHKK